MKKYWHIGAAIACAVFSSGAHAQVTETVLHSFTGGADGDEPPGSLLVSTDGASDKLLGLYGYTAYGAADGDGGIFKLHPANGGEKAWKLSPLWTFTGGADGGGPYFGGLFSETERIHAGTPLYGTTYFGAAGYGTVFSLTGTALTPIYTFTGGNDGGGPYYGVTADKNGALYTATTEGGANGCGTVIQLVPPTPGQTAWTENTIYSFTGAADGCAANAVTIDTHGALFGTTSTGGTVNDYCGSGCGTVFELVPPEGGQTAWTEQTIWSFQGVDDGASSYAPVTIGKGGVIFGTTVYGGGPDCGYYGGCGTVFEISPPAKGGATWTEQVIAAFSPSGNSSTPYAPVIIDKAGALYGTTSGYYPGNGSVFKLAPPVSGQTAWTLETLFQFPGSRTGSAPFGPVSADDKGVLYGTTLEGGVYGGGIVYSLTGTGFVPTK